MFEQKIYRVDNDDDRGIGLFARVSSSPSDRNPIDFYADGGVELISLSDRRPKDKFGIAAGYAHGSDTEGSRSVKNSSDKLSITIFGLGHAVAEGAGAIRALSLIAILLLAIYLAA